MMKPQSVKRNTGSVYQLFSDYIPANPTNPLLNPVNHRLTWAEALRLPGDNLFKRIQWAAIVFDALRAEAINYQIAANNILANQLVMAKEEAQDERRSSETHSAHKGEVFNDESMAGELDEDDNSKDAMDELEEAQEKLIMAQLAADVAHSYQQSAAAVRHQLNIEPQDDMTNDELDEWTQQNQGSDYDDMRSYLLDNIAEHGAHFDLEQVDMVDHFLKSMTAMIMRNDKTMADVSNLNPTLFAQAFDNHFDALSKLASGMVEQATHSIHRAGAALMNPAPEPQMSFEQKLNNELRKMGAPDLSKPAEGVTPDERMDQVRLAAIRVMYPNAPKPQNTLNRLMKPEPEQVSHQAIQTELMHYANVLGVGVKTLSKAADQTLLQKVWPVGSPNHAETKAMMEQNPVKMDEPRRESLAKREMKKAMQPHPQGNQ